MAKAVGTTPKQLLPLAKVRASLPDSTLRLYLVCGELPRGLDGVRMQVNFCILRSLQAGVAFP